MFCGCSNFHSIIKTACNCFAKNELNRINDRQELPESSSKKLRKLLQGHKTGAYSIVFNVIMSYCRYFSFITLVIQYTYEILFIFDIRYYCTTVACGDL